MAYDKPFTVEYQDPVTEMWSPKWNLHGRVNKTNGGQALSAGADQYRASLTFEVRWQPGLEELRYNPQPYRILYRDHTFKLVDYDDFMERHQTIRLVGEAYG